MVKAEGQVLAALHGHIARCRNATLPGDRIPLRIGASHVGYVAPDLAAALAGAATVEPGGVTIAPDDAARLNLIAAGLAPQFGFRMRGEDFDVRARLGGPVLAVLDRGALPAFGVIGVGAHLNGVVRRADGLHLWIARRSAEKKLDPGKLDNLVGGGVSAGMTPDETLVKEAAEEAAIPEALIAGTREVSRIAYDMARPEGLRRDVLVCYDLDLPEDFVPHAADGEVESFELMPARLVLERMASGEDFKFNVNLVLIDFLLRHDVLADDAGGLRTTLAAMPAATVP
ncbi:NUDIX domain-containing protein [Acidiphilium sp. AL]|uniref:NUDIX domain-containing protein n=1 Tax=Acidiphilium iwatense TaxID=768198 RepID=A0ABS9DSX9_9PROT|nr:MULTISPECIES: NUDIX domain-containing protein [Acidiphilium]MCF3945243.1 NUDIX domain-containing protein [Acidiphilium iwatense]MCU4159464.1 NUDIX domain-containing protein [Acidiphilium sp. AL]